MTRLPFEWVTEILSSVAFIRLYFCQIIKHICDETLTCARVDDSFQSLSIRLLHAPGKRSEVPKWGVVRVNHLIYCEGLSRIMY